MVTDFFNIGVLQRDTLAQYLFIICCNYILRMSINLIKENGFTLTKTSRGYPTKTMINADNANDQALLANAPAQTKYLPHIFNVNVNKKVDAF